MAIFWHILGIFEEILGRDLNYRQENRDWWGTSPEAEAAYAKGDKQDF